MRHFTIPIFIPELACPNRCVFCNQQKISGTLCLPGENEIVEIIESRLATIPHESDIELGFFGGNFTGIERKQQQFFLSIGENYLKAGKISGIRISTRPDYIDAGILSFLKEFGVSTIELGAQSVDDEVLRTTGRGHTVNDIRKAAEMILTNGFHLGLQMMIGLPGDTKEKSMQTARKIIELGAESTRIYPTLVIKDTELEQRYQKGDYVPLSLGEAISWTKDIVCLFEEAGVNILRIGLHPSEGLLSGENLVAGPFHVAFGEMVSSAIWREKFKTCILEKTPEQPGPNKKKPQLGIEVPIGQANAAIGHRAENKKWLLDFYSKVRVTESDQLRGRDFIISEEGEHK
jgi:histone acetyltransferase (RNA polymerase elongator complex component)